MNDREQNLERDLVISTRPVNQGEELLRQKFAESLVGQSDLMDKLAQQLIVLELAVPGLYAAVLKLVQGENATLPTNWWLYATFGCWGLALILTLLSLVPRRWTVDPTKLKGDPNREPDLSQPLSLEEFFTLSAQYKRDLLIAAMIFFWVGIFCGALLVF